MYAGGRGVEQDFVQAAKLFRLAADQGDADGQTLLGISYYSGKGVPRDFVIWNLQNGITLLVSYGNPAPPLAAIESFLSDVLGYFKQRRDEMHEEVFKDVPLQPGWASFEGRFYGITATAIWNTKATNLETTCPPTRG